MNFDSMLDNENAVDAKSVKTSTVSWKQLIIEHMINQPEAMQSIKSVLRATDSKFKDDESNYRERKKCFESQMTYIRQDVGIHILRDADDNVALVGLLKDGKCSPFKNAASLLGRYSSKHGLFGVRAFFMMCSPQKHEARCPRPP